ncbi:hypothetical protein DYI24_00095 [Rhodopseudomonas sp. BR0C11]|uniref:hypothetical protein n=1 Tax=Rhodopseudomonas sp. BR0C11 TaxID=2269370 RepID=UPI0019683B7C|nr:hypothetical protein [Rhodopseudomonas sp. BR0C11]NEV75481.1 hypothetical protein [Rhodopseudomonas sp. BR0C11]
MVAKGGRRLPGFTIQRYSFGTLPQTEYAQRRGSMAAKKETAMTAEAFRDWQEGLRIPNHMAARQLGVSTNGPTNYRQNGAGRTVALACSAIEVGLDPWTPEGRAEMRALRHVLEAIRAVAHK